MEKFMRFIMLTLACLLVVPVTASAQDGKRLLEKQTAEGNRNAWVDFLSDIRNTPYLSKDGETFNLVPFGKFVCLEGKLVDGASKEALSACSKFLWEKNEIFVSEIPIDKFREVGSAKRGFYVPTKGEVQAELAKIANLQASEANATTDVQAVRKKASELSNLQAKVKSLSRQVVSIDRAQKEGNLLPSEIQAFRTDLARLAASEKTSTALTNAVATLTTDSQFTTEQLKDLQILLVNRLKNIDDRLVELSAMEARIMEVASDDATRKDNAMEARLLDVIKNSPKAAGMTEEVVTTIVDRRIEKKVAEQGWIARNLALSFSILTAALFLLILGVNKLFNNPIGKRLKAVEGKVEEVQKCQTRQENDINEIQSGDSPIWFDKKYIAPERLAEMVEKKDGGKPISLPVVLRNNPRVKWNLMLYRVGPDKVVVEGAQRRKGQSAPIEVVFMNAFKAIHDAAKRGCCEPPVQLKVV